MPQDLPLGGSEETTQQTGGTYQSTEQGNNGSQVETEAGAPETTKEDLRAELEEEIANADQDAANLLEDHAKETDPIEKASLMDQYYHAKADAYIASTELKALEYGDLSSFEEYIDTSAGPLGGPGAFKPMDELSGINRLAAADRYTGGFLAKKFAGGLFEFNITDLLGGPLFKGAKSANRLRKAKKAKAANRAKKAAVRKKSSERIKGRKKKRNQRRCKKGSKNPVFFDTGAVSQVDPIFQVSGLFEVLIASTYQSDIEQRGPLGWGRVSDLDATLERLPNTKLRYRDGAGFPIDFDRPTPNIGQWNEGDHIRYMEIAAGKNRTFMIREEGEIRHFKKHPDGKWHLFALENKNGASLLFERDENGLLSAIETPEQLRLEFTNDNERNLRLCVDLVGRDGSRKQVMRYGYDKNDNLTLAECPFGDKHEYRYDDRHLRIWFRKNDQYEGNYHFDDAGRCILEETNGPYNGTRFEYDPERRITKHVPGGDPAKTEFIFYAEDGAVFTEAHISGRFTYSYYDDSGNTAAEQDGNGYRTHYKYDAEGNITSIEDPEGRISDFRWTKEGEMEFAIDPSGATWESDYDEFGNLVGTKDALGHDTEIKVNSMGQPTGICRHDGHIQFLGYSDNHWLTSIVDFDGLETVMEHDVFGRIVSMSQAGQSFTKYTYIDQIGSDFWTPAQVTLDGGIKFETRVIQPRRHIRQLDGDGRTTDFFIDGFGKIDATQDAKGGKLAFRYDKEEELAEVENQTGETWRFERDSRGRLVRETDFGGAIITYEYDDADRLTASTYPDGTRHLVEMDKSGLMTKETIIAPGEDPLVAEYLYDERALLKQAKNPDGTVVFERDANGQVIAETINGTRIESVYDCCGRRERRTIGDDITVYDYDPAGRLLGLQINDHDPLRITRDRMGHEKGRVSSMGFHLQQRFGATGLLLDQRLNSALTVSGGPQQGQTLRPMNVARTYQWNKSLEPTAIADNIWGTTQYAYDPNGQITTTRLGNGATETFGYDPRLNIASTGFQSPGGEQAQQITERLQSWQAGADGRVTEAQGSQGETITLTYDAKGRTIKKEVIRNGFRPQVWRFEWNGLDRMIAAHTPDGAKWTYGYDAFARRLWKQEWHRNAVNEGDTSRIEWQKGQRHDFLWDGDVVVSETVTEAGGTTRKVDWFFEPESFVPIARRENGYLSYVITDHLGTPREVVSERGELEWAAEYKTWGALNQQWRRGQAAPGNVNASERDHDYWTQPAGHYSDGNAALAVDQNMDASFCPIRFQGQWEDTETGLFYNRFRHYEPSTGTYVQTDPIGIRGSLRLFGYAKATTIMVDPFGLSLRTMLNGAGKGLQVPWQAHHIIPVNVFNAGAGSGMLRTLGIQRDSLLNGVALPTSVSDAQTLGMLRHSGSHRNYTSSVRDDLSRIERRWQQNRKKPGNRTCADTQARLDILALQERYRAEISAKGAAVPGTTMARAW